MKVIMKPSRGFKIEELRKAILSLTRELSQLLKQDYEEISQTTKDPQLIDTYVDDIIMDIIREFRKAGWRPAHDKDYLHPEGE